jgi:SSS family solute:Na+ symporter
MQWPHFMLLSFYLFVILIAGMILISLTDSDKTRYEIPAPVKEDWSRLAVALWIVLAVVMIGLYVFFN